ncbi:MAG: hypothetical protein JXR44_02960 [Thiotrichales bacterium]|nr:hypothetical protein [Thiotrichales bacterium]
MCLQAQQGSLQPLLERDLSYLNPLAHSVGEWQFVRVEFCDKDRYLLHFEYDWQVFSCMGLNASGRFVDKVAFCLEPNGVLCFDLHGFGHLSPADEL